MAVIETLASASGSNLTKPLRAQAEAASAAWREATYLRMVNRGILASGASRRRTKEEKKAKAQSKRTEGAPGERLDVKTAPRAAGRATRFKLGEWRNGTPPKRLVESNPMDRSAAIAC
jgi:hypothetical protein